MQKFHSDATSMAQTTFYSSSIIPTDRARVTLVVCFREIPDTWVRLGSVLVDGDSVLLVKLNFGPSTLGSNIMLLLGRDAGLVSAIGLCIHEACLGITAGDGAAFGPPARLGNLGWEADSWLLSTISVELNVREPILERDCWRLGERDTRRFGERDTFRLGERDSWRLGARDSWRVGERDSWRVSELLRMDPVSIGGRGGVCTSRCASSATLATSSAPILERSSGGRMTASGSSSPTCLRNSNTPSDPARDGSGTSALTLLNDFHFPWTNFSLPITISTS
mmetsp:Transcript_14829/g.28560  ORF Transcript_14829/g.28560 Transcript_14829/m.28560 type:complete len:280 (+) Transcript_14829:140-979(+)